MNLAESADPAAGPWPLPPPPVAAILITLETSDASPLLAVDPRAGDAVAARLRHLHAGAYRVLAYSVVADRALCLVTTPDPGAAARLVSHVVERTTDDLLELGHEHVWRWPAEVLAVCAYEPLAAVVDHVVRAPERAGLVRCWRDWRWAGSCQWPDRGLQLRHDLPPGLLWLDALTSSNAPTPGVRYG